MMSHVELANSVLLVLRLHGLYFDSCAKLLNHIEAVWSAFRLVYSSSLALTALLIYCKVDGNAESQR